MFLPKRILPCFTSIVFLFLPFFISAQQAAIPRSVPEKEGVSSVAIDSFLNAVNHSNNELHSFMLIRHGKVIAEGWWNPYRRDLKHSLYSTSKSFTSTAIGFAVTEKKISVQDKVISFFPDKLPDSVSDYLKDLTIKDLLTMSVGQTPDPTGAVVTMSDNWIKSFLALKIQNKPGTKFLYNTMATYMLSAIVQKVTGQKEIDYLRPRLFEPLGITGMDWEVSNEGINTGGWGLRLKTEDMAKFGLLYLNKGKWNGKQIIPAEWIGEATTFKIDQAPDEPQSRKDSSDWKQGYCYQFWRCRNNEFRADGAFGQYIIMMPKEDAVVAITAEVPDMQAEINLVWKYLLPALGEKTIPANAHAEKALTQHLASLSLEPLGKGNTQKGSENFSSEKKYTLESNNEQISSISFVEGNGGLTVTLVKNSVPYRIEFEKEKWKASKTEMDGPYLLEKAKEHLEALKPLQIAGSYNWQDANTLVFKIRFIESPHAETFRCHFSDKSIDIILGKSFNYGKNDVKMSGTIQ